MNAERLKVYLAIDGERDYQNATWPAPLTSVGDAILLIGHYHDKARRAWATEQRPEKNALGQLRKIAAIAVRAMEENGVVFRDGYERGPDGPVGNPAPNGEPATEGPPPLLYVAGNEHMHSGRIMTTARRGLKW